MPRELYYQEIKSIRKDVSEMGFLAKDAIWLAIEALIRNDGDRITIVNNKNAEIDNLEFRTETRCMGVIATQQPVGKDLRVLGTCLKIISDFDRLGDLAGNIVKIAKNDLTKDDPRPSGDHLLQMTSIVNSMLEEILHSFVTNEKIPIEKIQKLEDELDILFRGIRDFLIIETIRDCNLSKAMVAYSFVARYLERCGDHICNIASRIHYMHTGIRIKIE